MKLIKLNETHYIIVDDSEIKEDDYGFDGLHIFKCLKPFIANETTSGKNIPCFYIQINGVSSSTFHETSYIKKITHSIQPLELSTSHINTGKYHFDKIKPLSLLEVEEAIYGYSMEKAAYNFCDNVVRPKDETRSLFFAFCTGFSTHQELVKDKLFTVEDMENAYYNGWIDRGESDKLSYPKARNNFRQSLLPKTEWDVEFNEQGKIRLL